MQYNQKRVRNFPRLQSRGPIEAGKRSALMETRGFLSYSNRVVPMKAAKAARAARETVLFLMGSFRSQLLCSHSLGFAVNANFDFTRLGGGDAIVRHLAVLPLDVHGEAPAGTEATHLAGVPGFRQREVEMIRLAREMDLLTTPYVFNPDEATRMAQAGADILVAHMGLTTAGSIGAKTAKTLDQCVPLIDAMAAAARKVRGDVLVLCHGGPIAEPEDAAFILKHCTTIDGFYGASSMERLPTERAIREQTEKFTRIGRG